MFLSFLNRFYRPFQLFFAVVMSVMSLTVQAESENQTFTVDFTEAQTAEQETNLLRTSDGISIFRKSDPAFFLSIPQTIPIPSASPFLAIAPAAVVENFDPNLITLQVRFSEDGTSWDAWKSIHRFHDAEVTSSYFVGDLIYVDTTIGFFQYMVLFNNSVQSLTQVKLKNLSFDFFSPGEVQAVTPGMLYQATKPMNELTSCGCQQPGFATRTDWNCPDGQSPSCASPEFTTTTHMIVHHSAGPNSSSNWAATVLSIWNFHVNTNGWCDIGYNWIIDPDGIVYEGRGGGNNVKGAHFCGANSGTVGICLLGNFESDPPTAAALASLRKLLAWKSCDSNLDPLGTTFHTGTGKTINVISGHRDGCSTQCPGDAFYPLFPTFRTEVDTALTACQSVSSIDTEAALPGFSLFPNPVNQILSVSWDQQTSETGQYQLLNAQGSVIEEKAMNLFPGKASFTVMTSDIPAGLYILQVESGEAILRKRVVVRH